MKTTCKIFGIALAVTCCLATLLKAQNLYIVSAGNNAIGEYRLDGSAINGSLIYDPQHALGIAISGNHLFVATLYGAISEYGLDGSIVNNLLVHSDLDRPFYDIAISGNDLFAVDGRVGGTVAEYTISGEKVKTPLIAPVHYPFCIAISGTNMFVSTIGHIREYSTSGATINASFISGLGNPKGIAISGDHMFVADSSNGTVGEYGLDGTAINRSLISGLHDPWGIVISGSNLFVANNESGIIGEYTTSGETVNATLIAGLPHPTCMAIGPAQ